MIWLLGQSHNQCSSPLQLLDERCSRPGGAPPLCQNQLCEVGVHTQFLYLEAQHVIVATNSKPGIHYRKRETLRERHTRPGPGIRDRQRRERGRVAMGTGANIEIWVLRPCSPPAPNIYSLPGSLNTVGCSPRHQLWVLTIRCTSPRSQLAEVLVAIEVQDRGRSHLLPRQLQLQDKQDRPQAETKTPACSPPAGLTRSLPSASQDQPGLWLFPVRVPFCCHYSPQAVGWGHPLGEVLPERMRREEAHQPSPPAQARLQVRGLLPYQQT